MGMFDYLKCEMPLEGNDTTLEFQTKDFDCSLDKIVIGKDGLLSIQRFQVDPDGEVVFDGSEPLDGEIPKRFRFYTLNDKGVWVEYQAEAIMRIQVTKIEKVPDE